MESDYDNGELIRANVYETREQAEEMNQEVDYKDTVMHISMSNYRTDFQYGMSYWLRQGYNCSVEL